MSDTLQPKIAIIGGGPAGLMAAEVLAKHGRSVVVYEAKPSVARKFLRAGIGGLNITHAEDYDLFCTRYGARRSSLQPMLDRFTPTALREWAQSLGIATFEGSSGRVFPESLKAAPLLRAWVHRLREQGVQFQLRHRWRGWDDAGALVFEAPSGVVTVTPDAAILALGGASWPQLGSDGAWVTILQERGVQIAPLQSANSGFDVAWTERLRSQHAGAQLKNVALSFTDLDGKSLTRQGEFVISDYGVEGSLIYAFSQSLREVINARGCATFELDLLPAKTPDQVLAEVRHPRGARSLSSHLKGRLGISGAKMALLWEVLGKDAGADTARLAQAIKALPITVTSARPVAEAISTAGGVCFEAVDEHLMLKALPNVFVAGEMLDWEAPTGGYLLSACMAQGVWAAEGVLQHAGRA